MQTRLRLIQMEYPHECASEWRTSCALLTSSRACEYLKRILTTKAANRSKRGRRFFGEAYVAASVPHVEGYYGSFQWLTNERFLSSRPFPKGASATFQQQYRAALQEHFGEQLERLQLNARMVEEAVGLRPAAPDLWLVEPTGRHRFIEVKQPGDAVSDHQLAGLAVIAATLRHSRGVSVQIIELRPSYHRRFDELAAVLRPRR